MLYPDFYDLISFKARKSKLKQPSARLVKTSVAGNHHSPFRGQGLEFDSVREYVPGDDIRSIDWRVTARTGSPHLKLFKEDRERQIVLCVDMNASMRFGTRNTFKSIQAARIAAFLGWQGIAQHDRVSALLYGDVPGGAQFFPAKQTRKSLCSLLKMLSEPPIEYHEITLENALKPLVPSIHSGSLVYIISDFMDISADSSCESVIAHLRKKCDVVFISVNDRADQSLSPMGPLGFCGNQAEKIFVNTANRTGREAYAAQWKMNRQQLNALTQRWGIPFIELTTESDIYQDLTLNLRRIAKRKNR